MDDLCSAGPGGARAMAMFVGMWAAMMIPMMLPALAPALRRCSSVRGAAIAALGYFAVWTAVGLAVYPFAGIELRFPTVASIVLIAAGLVQFTAWKARRLACCRTVPSRGSTWGQGMRLGVECVACCGNLMVVLLATGMMNIATMVGVTLAIAAERHAPRLARPIGAIVVAAGLSMLVS